MASEGSSRNQEWCGRGGYQLVDNAVEHHCLALHPPLLESIPLEICKHGRNPAGSPFTKRAALRWTISSLSMLRRVCGSHTHEAYAIIGLVRDLKHILDRYGGSASGS